MGDFCSGLFHLRLITADCDSECRAAFPMNKVFKSSSIQVCHCVLHQTLFCMNVSGCRLAVEGAVGSDWLPHFRHSAPLQAAVATWVVHHHQCEGGVDESWAQCKSALSEKTCNMNPIHFFFFQKCVLCSVITPPPSTLTTPVRLSAWIKARKWTLLWTFENGGK